MRNEFDKFINRRGTSSVKWEYGKFGNENVLPMWVADMDFKSPPEVINALHERVDHGILGYTFAPPELEEEVIRNAKEKYNWNISSEWIVWLPGLVTGLNVCCRAIGNENDEVMTTTPIYPPFLTAPGNNNKNLAPLPMYVEEGQWRIDFNALARKINEDTKLFILCNPHNPTGRVFSEDELKELGRICCNNGVIICSDEVHCDLILDKDKKHLPIASLSNKFAGNTITLMSPSKTYNIAGLGCSYAIIPNSDLKEAFLKAMKGIVPHVNLLGYTAAWASYKYGSEWLDNLINYLKNNRDFVESSISEIKGLSMQHIESTYLAWIDARELGKEDVFSFFYDAGIALSDGKDFGFEGFVRLNFGCPFSTLKEGIRRMEKAVNQDNN